MSLVMDGERSSVGDPGLLVPVLVESTALLLEGVGACSLGDDG